MADGPFRIEWRPVVDITDERLASHLASASGYSREQRGVHPHPVAVVGGGPSIVRHLDELRNWPGEVWAINSMADWLIERGVNATLFTVDPAFVELKAEKALLASCCHPEMFKRSVRVFDLLEHVADGVMGGVTSATRAPALAVRLGYPGVVFFGCDSSFEDLSHVVHNDYADLPRLIVRASGRDFTTMPELVMQAENLSLLIRTFPDYFSNRSDGLLPAMVADDQWETVAVSALLKKVLIETNGDIGLYDKPYEEQACQHE